MKHFYRALQALGFFTMWSTKAMADGTITVDELAELAQGMGDIFAINLVIDVPAAVSDTEVGVSGDINPSAFLGD